MCWRGRQALGVLGTEPLSRRGEVLQRRSCCSCARTSARHGAAVLGSIQRCQRQEWIVKLKLLTTVCGAHPHWTVLPTLFGERLRTGHNRLSLPHDHSHPASCKLASRRSHFSALLGGSNPSLFDKIQGFDSMLRSLWTNNFNKTCCWRVQGFRSSGVHSPAVRTPAVQQRAGWRADA
jgi:hypothetical protein